ncbi:MAG: hypothetical protein WC635_12510 [Bacteriovorax sp.]|jgi:hypothetical protein
MDTICCGYRLINRSKFKYIQHNFKVREILLNADKEKYLIRHIKFKVSKENNKIPSYELIIKLMDISNPSRYVLFFAFRLGGYTNSYDFKFRTELSNFNYFYEFEFFIKRIAPSNAFWNNLIDSSIPCEVHLKTDMELKFDIFRLYLDYPYSKKPHIRVNPQTGWRTLYLSTNLYIYEKNNGVRLEKRYKSQKVIRRELNLKTFKDFKMNFPISYNPFGKLRFFNIARCRPMSKSDRTMYRRVLYIVNDKKIHKTTKGKKEIWIQKNSLLNSKEILNRKFKNSFSGKLIKLFQPICFDLKAHCFNEAKLYFKKECL